VGWLILRREAAVHGRGFWIRPLLVELCCGLAVVLLYWWEVVCQGLVAGQIEWQLALLPARPSAVNVPGLTLHVTLFSHTVLMALMLVASLIDVDEKLIPDGVTIPGTILGLTLAAAIPASLLPQVDWHSLAPTVGGIPLTAPGQAGIVNPWGETLWLSILSLVAPRAWPAKLAGAPQAVSLAVAVGSYWFWCFAIAPRTWYTRHGWRRAMCLLTARLARGFSTWQLQLLVWAGTAAIAALWWIGGSSWAGLLTALVGLVGAGSVVWCIRVIGGAALRREAMGFGDVTLMMMIGTFLGWQPCLIIFFVAPFAGLIVGLVQWMARGEQVIPYGPFLCLATVFVIVRWADVWNRGRAIFEIGWLVPAVLVVCMFAMGAILVLWRLVLTFILRGD
jgi:prepilin signal peptidase PulO-like enzyme (type II secretory pathway)